MSSHAMREEVEVPTLTRDAESPLLARSTHSKETYPPSSRKREEHHVFGSSSLYLVLFTIIFPLILAVILISCHHIFYAYLNGKPDRPYTTSHPADFAHSQRGAQTLGNGLAFLIKACLTSVIGTSFIQLSWRLVRRKPCTVNTLDAMWASRTDLFSFLNGGFWKSVPILVFLAIVSWSMPLVALFPASSITIHSVVRADEVPCIVPAMDMNTFRGLYAGYVDGDYPFTANLPADGIIQVTKLSDRYFLPIRPAECDSDSECTYNRHFAAPSLRCIPGDPDSRLPAALADLATSRPQWLAVGYNPDSEALADHPIVELDTHMAIYYLRNLYRFIDADSPAALVGIQQSNFTCSLHQAEYNVQFYFDGTGSGGNITMTEDLGSFHQHVGTFGSGGDYSPGNMSREAALNSLAIANAFFKGLVGSIIINMDGVGPPYLFSDGLTIQYTNLHDEDGFSRDLPRVLEDMFEQTILSFAVTGRLGSAETTCKNTRLVNTFDYNPVQLLTAYGSGLLASVFTAALGCIALFRTGRGTQAGFASFLEATRFSQLQHVQAGDKIRYAALADASYRLGFEQYGHGQS